MLGTVEYRRSCPGHSSLRHAQLITTKCSQVRLTLQHASESPQTRLWHYMLWMFGDEVLRQVAKSEPCGVIQGGCGRSLGVLSGHGKTPSIFVVNPKPRRKVWLICIKKTFHPILDP